MRSCLTSCWLTAVLLCVALSGCAVYHSLPLPTHADLAPSTASLSGAEPAATVVLRLGLRQAVKLAVARDPELAAARAQLQVAQAQAYDAGLLPDPALALSLDHPFNGGSLSDHHNAWSVNLSEDLIALIAHGDLHSAAAAHYAEALLSWRWQIEQVALKTRLTYMDAWAAQQELQNLRTENQAAQAILGGARRAQAMGALAAVLYQQALTQAASVRARLESAADREVQAQTGLATLLRADAGQDWQLQAPEPVPAPSSGSVAAALAALPMHRLDLLALQAGYQSADAQLRADILSQFPILNIGFTRQSDNTGVNMIGFGITLNLPIFNGNRGKIAVDRATRAALNAAYQAHLDGAVNEVRASFERLQLAERELASVQRELPALAHAAAAANKALARGDMTRFDAFATRSAWFDARINADQLRASVVQLTFTLQTLLAEPEAVAPAGSVPQVAHTASLGAVNTRVHQSNGGHLR